MADFSQSVISFLSSGFVMQIIFFLAFIVFFSIPLAIMARLVYMSSFKYRIQVRHLGQDSQRIKHYKGKREKHKGRETNVSLIWQGFFKKSKHVIHWKSENMIPIDKGGWVVCYVEKDENWIPYESNINLSALKEVPVMSTDVATWTADYLRRVAETYRNQSFLEKYQALIITSIIGIVFIIMVFFHSELTKFIILNSKNAVDRIPLNQTQVQEIPAAIVSMFFVMRKKFDGKRKA